MSWNKEQPNRTRLIGIQRKMSAKATMRESETTQSDE